MTDPISSRTYDNITCPFCGLACDDLRVEVGPQGTRVLDNGCPLSAAGFTAPADDGVPRVGGVPADLSSAVDRAAALLGHAALPLLAGLGTDVAGARGLVRLAERCGGVLDHMNGDALLRNQLVLQDSGWMTTTLSEVKNRVDLLVVLATDVAARFPRFFERAVWNDHALFAPDPEKREVIVIGAQREAVVTPAGHPPTVVPCAVAQTPEVIAALRALVRGRTLQAEEVAGIAMGTLQGVAERLKAARYGVMVWGAAALDFPHGELTIQAATELIKDLNRSTRFSGLALAGANGDVTVNQVVTWQTGYPARVGFGRGYPEYDPHHLTTHSLLESREADVLLWVSAFDAQRTPPATDIPTIVLGRAGMRPPVEPEVLIPVATPGIDHPGHIFRTDSVVALPLRQLRETRLPTVAAVANAIASAL